MATRAHFGYRFICSIKCGLQNLKRIEIFDCCWVAFTIARLEIRIRNFVWQMIENLIEIQMHTMPYSESNICAYHCVASFIMVEMWHFNLMFSPNSLKLNHFKWNKSKYVSMYIYSLFTHETLHSLLYTRPDVKLRNKIEIW